MSLNKLARQLRREAMGNPKKAAILAVLVLVAVYFWGPLVWGWVAPEEASGEPPNAKAEATAEPATFANTALAQSQELPDKEQKACPHPWTQLDEWMREDPMTTPAEEVTGWRDPFASALAVVEVDQHEAVQAAVAPVTPESLGVELSGTLIGPRRRVALIGGKAYRAGQTVTVDHAGRPIHLQLVEVHPRRIVLEWEGNRFDLAIPEQKTTGQIELGGQTR